MSIMEPDRFPGGWHGVELRHLAALQALGDELSFGGAARRLGYTQSAISQQIAALERAVGERLVERPGGPRPVALTEAGRLLVGHADAIVARLQAAQADMAALSEGAAGTLRVGSFQSVGARVLPAVMSRFTHDWPDIEIELHESAHDDELATWVERGQLDLAFVMLPIDGETVETAQLLVDPYVLVVRPDSPLLRHAAGVGGRPPTLREIAAERLIGFRDCRSTGIVEAQLRASGREPNFVFRSDDNGTLQGLASAGVGVAIMPRLTVEPSDETVRLIDIGTRMAPRLIGLAWHRDRYQSPSARAFVETARAVCAELERPILSAA
jgi:DNA-binding transcriptional LysR family regulator